MIQLSKDPALFSSPEWLSLARVFNADRDRLNPPQADFASPHRFPDLDYLLSWLVLSEQEQEARWRVIFGLAASRLDTEKADLPRIAADEQALRGGQLDEAKARVLDFLQAAAVVSDPVVDPIVP